MTMTELRHDPGDAHSAGFAFDVVGIGALNLDYVATASRLRGNAGAQSMVARISQLADDRGPALEWGVEHHVDERMIHAAIEAASSARLETTLGGSAFNAIQAIAQTQVGLRLGYVGIAGRVPVLGMSIGRQLDALGVDRRFVLDDERHLCGICLSFIEDGDRTLLTHAGANEHLAEHIDRHFEDLVQYLASARVVHVTSFLDDRTADRLLPLLQEVKKRNQETLVSFDPGHVWSSTGSPGVDGILRISDYLLVNYREFQELGHAEPGDSRDRVAARLHDRFDNEQSVLVVKRSAGIWSYRREDGKLTSSFYAQAPLAEDEIEDSTGAGDVFAAGLLTVLTCDRLQIELGSLLGMSLARHKLRYVGSAGHAQFAEVTKKFIASLDAERRGSSLPRGVFIAHGANPEWLAVQRFIETRFQVPVYSFESRSWGSRQVTEALSNYLERCSFAICVLTAENFGEGGLRQARQNVIHEVGLFQGRHGFDRVMMLVEEGCDFSPGAAGPYTVSFPSNGISETFYHLDKMIRQGFDSVESH
jgi:sugar/nucleoside kinase (ribokinase family)